MTLNSADVLLEYFGAAFDERSNWKFDDIWRALLDVQDRVEVWAKQGKDVTAFRHAIPIWRSAINARTDEKLQTTEMGVPPVSTGDLGVLRWASSLINETPLAVSVNKRDDIAKALGKLKKLLAEDGSLPPELRLHIASLILHVEDTMHRWEFVGDFAVEDAIERLFGALRTAEAASSDPTAWQKFWTDWGQPIAVAALGGAPQTVLAITTLLGGA